MIEEKQINLFIKVLYKRYTTNYGVSLSRLNDWRITPSMVADEDSLVNSFDEFGHGLELHDKLILIFDELEARKLVRKFREYEYCLTHEGVAKAKQGTTGKVIEYFNLNPGLNTIVAVAAFVISCFALYFSITKP